MLDPGRYFAEAIYFLQYTLAQILWAIDRALLSIAVIAESVNAWITDNIGYFVELLVNALSAPLGGLFILALTALGFWYALNHIVPTQKWVDPGKLLTYGLIAFFFFSSPIVVVDMMEELRQSLNAGIDQALIDGAAGDIFDTTMDGTDIGLPGAIPDVNSDGVVGSFDLVAAFMAVANLDELDSSEFPADFEATYFPFGDPSAIDLSDEADQELAKALASDGIERLFFALVAIPAAIAEHFLRLALTAVAMFLYAGVPFAMLLAFFVYTQAFLGAYLKQFVNLLIETFLSVVIAAIMIGLLAAAAQQGIGLYIGASVIACLVLLWRIKGALRLASAAFNLFGGGTLTGGAGGMEIVNMGKQAALGAAGLAGAALTGGATMALGGAVLGTAAALGADGRAGGEYLGTDPAKTGGRVRQLKTIAGYALGHSQAVRGVIENVHEVRTLARNFREGEVSYDPPDTFDYLRAGASMSGFGSSPWLAMRISPSLRAAYDEIGGRAYRDGFHGHPLDQAYDNGAPVHFYGRRPALPAGLTPPPAGDPAADSGDASGPAGHTPSAPWRDDPATSRQRAELARLGLAAPDDLTRGEAGDQILRTRWGVPEASAGQAVGGAASSLDQQLLAHFASLEQALAALAAALGGSMFTGRLPGALPAESAHTSIPSQRPETPTPVEDGQDDTGTDARQGQGGPDPATKAPTSSRDTTITAVVDDVEMTNAGQAAARDSLVGQPASAVIRLEPQSESRQEIVRQTIAHLAEPHSLAGQAARETLATYAGERNAALAQEAVEAHSAGAVQAAADAVSATVAGYREQGHSDAAVLAAFQSGEAMAIVRETLAEQGAPAPLSDEQLTAVADVVLLPQWELTREELAAVIGQQAAAGATGEQAVVEALAMPTDFGSQTGLVRGVLAGAREMRLSPAELEHFARLTRDGLRQAVQDELLSRGHRPA
ncbi:MAG: hypothetical protein L0322_24260, partial [Chloroflexi bacterium]|nr:hypothetical protein [Chloroflexota bacterium]